MGWKIAQVLIFTVVTGLYVLGATGEPEKMIWAPLGGFLAIFISTGVGTRIADFWPRHRWKGWHIGLSIAAGLLWLLALPLKNSGAAVTLVFGLVIALSAGLAFLLGFAVVGILNMKHPRKKWQIGFATLVGLSAWIAPETRDGSGLGITTGVFLSLLFFGIAFGVFAIVSKWIPLRDNADLLTDDLAGGVEFGDHDPRSLGEVRRVGGGVDANGSAAGRLS